MGFRSHSHHDAKLRFRFTAAAVARQTAGDALPPNVRSPAAGCDPPGLCEISPGDSKTNNSGVTRWKTNSFAIENGHLMVDIPIESH